MSPLCLQGLSLGFLFTDKMKCLKYVKSINVSVTLWEGLCMINADKLFASRFSDMVRFVQVHASHIHIVNIFTIHSSYFAFLHLAFS